MLFCILFIICFIPLSLMFPIKKVGKKNLKELRGKNYIISCNHMSGTDPVMLDISFKKKHYFLAKIELFRNKFKGWFLKRIGGVPVDRKNVDPKSIKTIFRLIAKKKHIAIFPQGTRTKTPEILDGEAKDGVAMFAIRTNTPVVPMMYNRKIKLFRKTKLIIGKPIYPDETRKKDKTYISEFSNLIIDEMNKLLQGEK